MEYENQIPKEELYKYRLQDNMEYITALCEKEELEENKELYFTLYFQDTKEELLIAQNLDKFRKLRAKGYNVNFQYVVRSPLNKDDFETGPKFSLEKVEKSEEFLDLIVEQIKSQNLSPLETYIAVYDIVKSFKRYKEGEYFSSARGIYEILNNSSIVCTGYADLMSHLLTRLGIPNRAFCMSFVDDGEHNNLSKQVYHQRIYTYIKDEKYGINGYYVADPTKELHGGEISTEIDEATRSSYKYGVMTSNEAKKISDYIIFNDEVITANSPKSLRYAINQRMCNNPESDFLYSLQMLDPEFVQKNPNLDLGNDNDCYKIIANFKYKTNITCPEDKLLDAIMTVKRINYARCFSEEDFEDIRWSYLFEPPFCLTDNKLRWRYQEEYRKYAYKRLNGLMNLSVQELQEKYPNCSIRNIRNMIGYYINGEISRNDGFANIGTVSQCSFFEMSQIKNISRNKKYLEKNGITISEKLHMENGNAFNEYILTWKEIENGQNTYEYMEYLKNIIGHIEKCLNSNFFIRPRGIEFDDADERKSELIQAIIAESENYRQDNLTI